MRGSALGPSEEYRLGSVLWLWGRHLCQRKPRSGKMGRRWLFWIHEKKRTLLKIARADVFFQVFFSKIRCSIRIALWVNHLAPDLHGGYQLSSVTIPFYPEYVMSKSHTVMICWPMDDWDAAIILTPQIMSALTSDKVTAASGARNWCFPIRAHRGKEPGVPVWLWIALFHEMSLK